MGMPVIEKRVTDNYDTALEKVTAALKEEGFGILTEIDVKQAFKEKIGVDFCRYKILGACNPKLAHQALSKDFGIGVLLPCNVVVFEHEGGGSGIYAMDPVPTIAALGGDEFKELADEVRARLERALGSLDDA